MFIATLLNNEHGMHMTALIFLYCMLITDFDTEVSVVRMLRTLILKIRIKKWRGSIEITRF
jgi:hypothetical protein